MTRHDANDICSRRAARHRLGARLAALLVGIAVIFGVLTASSGHAATSSSTELPDAIELQSVPFFAQEEYQCGPAALAMTLAWSGLAIGPEELVEEVYSPARNGSLPTDMIGAARRHGRMAYPVTTLPNLLAEVAAGNPVIVLQDLGNSLGAYWHFAVVVGYDMASQRVMLHSGTEEREVMSFQRFERAWQPGANWGLVVLPAMRLPASAEETSYLEATTALEQIGQSRAAAQAYRAALTRWPESLGALMGLGNTRYALNDLHGAEGAFREATRHHPTAAPAFNNLAHVLSELGRHGEALAAARRAIALGGPQVEVYRTTLREVQGDTAPQALATTAQWEPHSAVEESNANTALVARENAHPFDGRWRGTAKLLSGLGCHGTVHIDFTVENSKVRGRWRVRSNNYASGNHDLSGVINARGVLTDVHASSAFLFVLGGQLSERRGSGEFRVAGWQCTGPWQVTRAATGRTAARADASNKAASAMRADLAEDAAVADRLEEVARLLSRGLISPQEAATKRQQILSHI